MVRSNIIPLWARTRPSEPFAPEEETATAEPTPGRIRVESNGVWCESKEDYEALQAVFHMLPGRERDVALYALTDEQLAAYLQVKYGTAVHLEAYRQTLYDSLYGPYAEYNKRMRRRMWANGRGPELLSDERKRELMAQGYTFTIPPKPE